MLCQAGNRFDEGKTIMKCYTLSEKKVEEGVSLAGLPVDASFGKATSTDSLKVVILMKERDGIVPDELLEEDAGRAAAVGRVMLTKSGKDSKGRFAVLYNPREWFLDSTTGGDGFVVYRSRGGFIAVSRGKNFTMRSSDGSLRLSVSKNGAPVVSETGKTPVNKSAPGEDWFLATME